MRLVSRTDEEIYDARLFGRALSAVGSSPLGAVTYGACDAAGYSKENCTYAAETAALIGNTASSAYVGRGITARPAPAVPPAVGKPAVGTVPPPGSRQSPPGSVSPDAVQADYPYHPASGSHIGPQGGRAINTGRVDGGNRTIFQREGGGYYVLDGQSGKQITVPSPYRQAGSPAGSLHRPGLRVGTRQAVYERYTKLANGSYMDMDGNIIKPPIQIGHAYGWENRRLLRAGEELGMTQKQLNDYVNARPERFRLENGSENMSHRHEKPGNGELQRIKEDMVKFLRERNHQ